jgi:hypothetical protein
MALLRTACDEADLQETLARDEALYRDILSKLPENYPADGLRSLEALHRADIEKIRAQFAKP